MMALQIHLTTAATTAARLGAVREADLPAFVSRNQLTNALATDFIAIQTTAGRYGWLISPRLLQETAFVRSLMAKRSRA